MARWSCARPSIPYMWAWLFKMLRNCTSARYAVNKARMVPIAEYSRDRLRELRATAHIAYDERSQGTLQLFRTDKQLAGIGGDVEVLKQFGVPFEVLDPAGCVAAEPALAKVRGKFVGGLQAAGRRDRRLQDVHRKARRARRRARRHVPLRRRRSSGWSSRAAASAASRPARACITADAYVVALGSYSPMLLRSVGISAPVYPIKGYSITVPITDAAGAPESTVMDETYKVAITRLGERIRVGGTAEISGYDLRLHTARRATLEHSVGDLFPEGGDLSKASFWCGLRPMTPDGPPIIGGTRYANLYLNTGHGTLGWTMACGSGRVLADIMSGRKPEIDVGALGISRYG